MDEETKRCSRCRHLLGLSEFAIAGTSDLARLCIACRTYNRDRQRAWRSTPEGREATREIQRRRVERDPQAKKDADRAWYLKHRKRQTS